MVLHRITSNVSISTDYIIFLKYYYHILRTLALG
nr:MAG TPA: hypothetical protein [Caudoviricetes sp.]